MGLGQGLLGSRHLGGETHLLDTTADAGGDGVGQGAGELQGVDNLALLVGDGDAGVEGSSRGVGGGAEAGLLLGA